MKEEIGHLPGSSRIVCQCCRNPLSRVEISKKNREEFNSCHFDHYEYTNFYEYICDACVRDSKINAILSPN
jgi:hypothetical protein